MLAAPMLLRSRNSENVHAAPPSACQHVGYANALINEQGCIRHFEGKTLS
ncbi:uncharacterized protein SOCE836_014540 [Sorangium cellulosum]|uniref:Uncharacterized protein n=1 Tax=Sorangium cellulosum TaxID=56 RepID=A0A4P2QHM7_SORCE|nr:uncharacterized protein SOCE836_014540 [Sorangium cellulosum]WCQ88758.1 hypothetical protein NQZ70_01439 [Sorangium sp. Soce836]